MSPSCPNCGEDLDVFHSCSSRGTNSDSPFETSGKPSRKVSLLGLILIAPLLGVPLDLFLPLPSSLVHSLLVSVLGSTIVAIFWVTLRYEGNKTFKFYLKNFKNFVFTPLILKIFTTEDSKKATISWLGVIAVSTAIQVLFFTPGNSAYLESRVSKQIDEASGANLQVECPSNFIYLYNDQMECRVKTGILGITVPARAQLSPLVGSAEIKVSLV